VQILASDQSFWTQLNDRIAHTGNPILLLERWPRGAGQRSWYLLAGSADVASARKLVRPGSSLTAYLHPQLPVQGQWSQQLAIATKALVDKLGAHEELVALVDSGSRPLLDAEYIADADELEGWGPEVAGATVWIGKYPDWPDDGEDAVTRVVPDADGVARAHPY
jgi:hypothetical protein